MIKMVRSGRRSQNAQTQREVVEECMVCEEINHGEEKIYCVQYGARRREQYPDYYFCHECDLAEEYFCNPKTLGKWPPKWANSKFQCKAKHDNLLHPTDKGRKWSQSAIKLSDKFKTKIEEINCSDISVPNTPQSQQIISNSDSYSSMSRVSSVSIPSTPLPILHNGSSSDSSSLCSVTSSNNCRRQLQPKRRSSVVESSISVPKKKSDSCSHSSYHRLILGVGQVIIACEKIADEVFKIYFMLSWFHRQSS